MSTVKIEEKFNDELERRVRCFIAEDETVYVNLEDVSIGLGFISIKRAFSKRNGQKVYSFVRWRRVFKYLNDFGFKSEEMQMLGEDSYVPESAFYSLAMKAKNKRAKSFQRWIAYDVIPSIRRNGAFVSRTCNPIREMSIYVRKLEASSIDKLVMYYRVMKRPVNAKALFAELSTMVNSVAKIDNGERDKADIHQLSIITFSELNIRSIIEIGIGHRIEPDDIKAAIWDWLLQFSHYTDLNTPAASIRKIKKQRFHVVK